VSFLCDSLKYAGLSARVSPSPPALPGSIRRPRPCQQASSPSTTDPTFHNNYTTTLRYPSASIPDLYLTIHLSSTSYGPHTQRQPFRALLPAPASA